MIFYDHLLSQKEVSRLVFQAHQPFQSSRFSLEKNRGFQLVKLPPSGAENPEKMFDTWIYLSMNISASNGQRLDVKGFWKNYPVCLL